MSIREELTTALARAMERARREGAVPEGELPPVRLAVPPSPDLGDFSSDAAAAAARSARTAPRPVAEAIAGRLERPPWVERVDVTDSGILNFHLRPDWLEILLRQALREGGAFGRSGAPGAAPRVQVEYVSAYPTGPLTVSHGRGAALGDALANLLEWTGCRVSREFYVNDAGSRMERFGQSLEARYLQALGHSEARVPVDGFHDPYVAEVAERIRSEFGDRWAGVPHAERLAALTRAGRDAVLAHQKETLERFGTRFDEWSSETALYESGRLQETLALLRESGYVDETDGALWLRSSVLGDEEDRPLLRSNREPTYLAGDLAYHLDKFRRGFDHVIDIWGPEHAAYVDRTLAGIRALGFEPDRLEILILQPVMLKLGGTLVDGSAPTGHSLLLDEILESVGPEVARFFYLLRPAGSPLELDLDLARLEAPENPAWRVFRARDAAHEAAEGLPADPEAEFPTPADPAGQALMRKLGDFPDEVHTAAREREPARLARYAVDVADAWDAFAPALAGNAAEDARALARVTAIVLDNALAILGVRRGA